MSLWLSPTLRKAYQKQEPQNTLDDALRNCGLDLGFATRTDLIAASVTNNASRSLPEDLRKRMLEFCESRDIVQLYATLERHPSYDFKRFYDRETGTTNIVIADRSGNIIALVNPRGLKDRLTAADNIDNCLLYTSDAADE